MDAVRRRRERKILKIYHTPHWWENPKLVHRLRCLELAEANAIQKNFEKSMPDMAKFDEDLRHAKELLEKHGSEQV